MATAELDLTDISTLKCRLYGVSMTTNAEQTSDLSGKVLQRCLSIPLTMRLLLKIWEGRSLPAVMNNLSSGSGSSNGSYNLNLGSGGKDQTGQNASGTASGMPDFTNGETKIKQEPGLNNGSNGCMGGRQTQQQQQSSSNQLQQQQQQQQQQSFLDAGTENSIGFPSYSGQSDTTTMTMSTVGTNNASASMLNPLQLGALLGQAKNSLTSNSNTNERSKKTRKRKTGTDGLWRSPKRKSDGGDSSTATEILLESSSSENSTPLGTPTGGRENLASETRTSTPTSAASLTSGMDFSNLDTTDILDKSTSDYDLDNSERDSEIIEVQHSGPEQQQQQQPQQDVEELIKIRDSSSTRKSKKNRGSGSEEKKSSPTNIFVDETSTSTGNKSLPVPPSVSITPISCGNLDQASTTNYNSVLTGMGLERRPGIEIIPIVSSPSQTNLPSSITITPITGPAPSPKTSSLASTTEDRQRSERKSGGGKSSSSSSKSSSEDNKSGGNKLEKRRKRKREDGPMGPPDKVPSGGKQQQDPLSKPVSVSIKPSSEQSPPSGGSVSVGLSCSSSRPTSPAAVRKFSPSPTHSSSLATLVSKSSPTLKASQTAAATCGKPVQSPKHSPVYGSSPKHNAPNVPVVPMSLSVSTVPNTVGNVPSGAVSVPVPVPASASPKHGNTSSPKHGSSAASSGKPSMSALKSAANSPSSKSSGSSSSDTITTPSKVKSSSSSSSKDSSSRGDKERRTSSVGSSGGSSSGHQSPKTKSSSSKLKQLEMIPSGGGEGTQVSSLQASGGSTPPSGQVDAATKSAIAAQQARNRKSSLNAVIDKLKNAQHCTETDTCGNGGGTVKGSGSSGLSGGNTGGISGPGQKEKSIGGGGGGSSSSSGGKTIIEGGKSSCVTKNASVETKNPAEYMVKHSSDGIKITINKTRTKDSKQSTANLKLSGTMAVATSSSSLSSVASSSSSSSVSNIITGSNGSPKTHTGLKPGVNSGPASKKPQTLQTAQKLLPTKMMLAAAGIKSAISSSGATSTGGGVSITSATATGGIGGNLLSKSSSSSKASGSPKTSSGATDLSRSRDKPRIPKSGDKGIFASKGLGDGRKSSPSALREESESERAFKLLAAHASISSLPPSLPPQLVMEGLMKQLDTKFQIPKLSARANVADAAEKNKSSDKLSILSDSAKQALDGLKQEQGKLAGLSNVTVSVSKSSLSDDQSRRDHSQNKPDNLSITTTTSAISLNIVGENAGLMLPPQSAADPDVPTNLCIQPMVDEASRDSCKDLGMRQTSTSQQFLGKIDDTSGGGILSKSNIPELASSGTKSYATMTGSSASTASSGTAIVAESLNLSTKPADQATLQTKYNKIAVEEKKQQQPSSSSSSSSSTLSSSSSSSSSSIFSSLGNIATTSDGNPNLVMTSDSIGSGGSGNGGEQEVAAAAAAAAAAEMLLDFSAANKDPMTKGGHGLPTSLTQHHLTTIPERAMTQAASTVRRNTPPPPPPPPPLPAPFPPAASPSVSVHIVKSPAPSPRVIPPSPHSSASPCITDDELMDEALVGMGK